MENIESKEKEKGLNINFIDTKPIFADEVALAIKVKATKNDKNEVEKEGQVVFIFLDVMKQQALGEFVLSRFTAKALLSVLSENLKILEKQLSDKSMPKPPEIRTTADPTLYR